MSYYLTVGNSFYSSLQEMVMQGAELVNSLSLSDKFLRIYEKSMKLTGLENRVSNALLSAEKVSDTRSIYKIATLMSSADYFINGSFFADLKNSKASPIITQTAYAVAHVAFALKYWRVTKASPQMLDQLLHGGYLAGLAPVEVQQIRALLAGDGSRLEHFLKLCSALADSGVSLASLTGYSQVATGLGILAPACSIASLYCS